MSKIMGNFIGLDKIRALGASYGYDALRYYLLRAAPFGSDLDWLDADFNKSYNELANVLGNCLNRVLNMTGRYRDGVLPARAATTESIDQNLIDQTKKLPQALADAYAKFELQHCALLPIELVRTTNGYIDATAPFKLAKDPNQKGRLDTILNLSAQAVHAALVALLPLLPDKANEGLKQLNAQSEGSLAKNFERGLPAGHQLGQAQPLFPKLESAGEQTARG